MPNLAIAFRAHPPDDDDILRALEWAVLAAVLDNTRGDHRPDAGKPGQLLDGCLVDIQTLIILRRDSGITLREDGAGKKKRISQ